MHLKAIKLSSRKTLSLQSEPNAYPASKSDTVALFVNDREYKVYLAKLPYVNAPNCPELIVFGLGWSGMMDELAIQPDQFFAFTLKLPKAFIISHKLHGYSSAVVIHCHKKFVFKLRKRAILRCF
uniref:Uncharacterized protein n=1 Tax=Tanacetum cinerariifolium TaxID=118510 RepID=A0A699HIX0_TANCI|nr:hypothetical protein [Tanacetum cinerariifolium]